jgi:hypothetical protein
VLFDEKRMAFLGLYLILISRKAREEENKTLVFLQYEEEREFVENFRKSTRELSVL